MTLPDPGPAIVDRAGLSAHLEEMLDVLWPDAWTHRRGRPWHHDPPSDLSSEEYLVLPDVRDPRLVVPLRPRRATAGALRQFKASASGRKAVKSRALSTAAGLGLLTLLPDRVDVHPPGSGVTGYLSGALSRDLLVSLYLGPPRAVQKPVLQLLTRGGQTFGFAKVSTNHLTQRLIQAEAAALLRMSGVPRRRLRVPQLLHHGQWNERDVTVQESLTVASRSRPEAPLLSEATVELAALFGVRSSPLSTSSYWRRLCQRIRLLPESSLSRTLESARHSLEVLDDRTPVSFGSWHGDWAPWNMTQSGGQLLVWDWEHLDTDVPLGFDALHHHIQRLVVSQGAEPVSAFESTSAKARSLVQPFGDPQGRLSALVLLLYALEIAVRYLEDGELDVGTRMGRLNSWLPVTLDGLVRAAQQQRDG